MKENIRRKDRIMDDTHLQELLVNGEYGIMSTIDEEMQPYGIPLSYVVMDEHIYFHSAPVGRKINNINFSDVVSFTIVGKTQPIYDFNFTTYYESVIVFGIVSKVDDDNEKINSLKALCEKYLPNDMDHFEADVKKSLPALSIYKISINDISGKEKKKK